MRKRLTRAVLCGLSASALALAAACARPAPVRLRDVDGRPHALPVPRRKATVAIFVAHDCPIANAYAPEINRIAAAYAPKGIAFYVVYPDPALAATTAQRHAREYGYRCPALLDPDHTLVKRTGVSVTPEAAVISAGGRLLYRGRIDDLYVDFGRRRPAPATRDLRQALDAVLAGRPVANPTTTAIGCFIPE